MIHYRIFEDLSIFKVSILHEETSEIGKKYFVGCYTPWPKDGIYDITNIGLELLMYIPNMYLLKSSFLFRGNSKIQFNHKKNPEQTKQDKYDETMDRSGNYCK